MRSFAVDGQTNPNHGEEQMKKIFDRGMARSLPKEKFDRRNYALWSYKIH